MIVAEGLPKLDIDKIVRLIEPEGEGPPTASTRSPLSVYDWVGAGIVFALGFGLGALI